MLPDPVGEMIEMRTLPNGMMVGKMRVPFGVIGAVYENRPNVTVDIASLCLKAGSATSSAAARRPSSPTSPSAA